MDTKSYIHDYARQAYDPNCKDSTTSALTYSKIFMTEERIDYQFVPHGLHSHPNFRKSFHRWTMQRGSTIPTPLMGSPTPAGRIDIKFDARLPPQPETLGMGAGQRTIRFQSHTAHRSAHPVPKLLHLRTALIALPGCHTGSTDGT
jgi:hypothetical protein